MFSQQSFGNSHSEFFGISQPALFDYWRVYWDNPWSVMGWQTWLQNLESKQFICESIKDLKIKLPVKWLLYLTHDLLFCSVNSQKKSWANPKIITIFWRQAQQLASNRETSWLVPVANHLSSCGVSHLPPWKSPTGSTEDPRGKLTSRWKNHGGFSQDIIYKYWVFPHLLAVYRRVTCILQTRTRSDHIFRGCQKQMNTNDVWEIDIPSCYLT